MRWRPGLGPGPRWGAHNTLRRPPSRLGSETPLSNPYLLGAFGASILAPSALSLCAPNVKSWLRPCPPPQKDGTMDGKAAAQMGAR